MCTLTAYVCMHAAICIAKAIRKTSFTASVKLARGSAQDVHTPDLPIVNRLNSVSLNSPGTSLALPLAVLMGVSKNTVFLEFNRSFKLFFRNFRKK